MRKRRGFVVLFVLSILLAVTFGPSPQPASAAVTDAVPNQAQCESGGSAAPLWGSGTGGRTRPVVTAMTVNGEVVPDPTNPDDHKLGVTICTPFTNARKIGVSVVHREGSSYVSDLTGAQTPSGAAYQPSMDIRIELADLGSQAEHFTFAQVYGEVDQWETTDLGTPTAAVDVTLRPSQRPIVDFNAPGAQFCSATPPECNVDESGLDVNSASLYMDFDEAGSFENMSGAYFATTGAVSGYVTGSGNGIEAALGGPHFEDDGATLNIGSMQALLPDDVITQSLGLDPDGLSEGDLDVSREESGNTTDAPFDLTEVTGGYLLEVSNIEFSSPRYSITNASSSLPPGPGTSPGGGYRMFAGDGGVFSFGQSSHGSAASVPLAAPVVGGASRGNDGYWEVAADGGVFAFGNAPFHGSAAGLPLKAPIVGMASASDGNGYYLVAADGGVFAFGSARFEGSAGSLILNKPVVGMAADPNGGYRLFASDGGVFDFGTPSLGSAATSALAQPIVGGASTGDGGGFWLVARDGGVFAFGNARFSGSAAPFGLGNSVVGISGQGTGGYVLATASGAAYAFGESQYRGGVNGLPLSKPVTAIS